MRLGNEGSVLADLLLKVAEGGLLGLGSEDLAAVEDGPKEAAGGAVGDVVIAERPKNHLEDLVAIG